MSILGAIIAGAAAFFLGAIWYSFLFQNQWKKAIGFEEDKEMKNTSIVILMGTTLFIEIIVAILISYVMVKFNITEWNEVFIFSLVLALIVILSSLKNYLYEAKPKELFYISEGYKFVITILMVVIIKLFM